MGDQLKDNVKKEIEKNSEKIKEVSKRIHQNPELGFEEYKAQQWISEILNSFGFQVEKGLADMETAIRAVHPEETKGPKIAILGEYDALPDLGHACGHNLIAGAALGACIGLSPFKQDIPGRLEFLGTPAEESEGGKVFMVDAGVFDDIDVAMMIHPSTETVAYSRSAASQEVELRFQGKPTHAAASPDKGTDPLKALIQTFVCVDTLRQHHPTDARIHGVITKGGEKANMYPEEVVSRFTIRGTNNEKRDALLKQLRDCGESAARAAGAGFSFENANKGFQALMPNRKLAEKFADNLEELGEKVEEGEDGMGTTDMGDVSQACAAIHPYLSISEDDISGHSHEFEEAAGSERGLEAMITAAKALAMTAVDVALDKDFYNQLKS
ncbi:M20 family metallopeptidase [Candidatus Bipolaricaulota bacterium]|nr:M20 family metallopeptidase [Candidatus Bipolaricaulota bacterium]